MRPLILLVNVKKINVVAEEKVNQLKYKKETIYNVEILFNEQKPLYDDFVVLHNYFIKLFKIYRCFIDFDKRSFRFTLKERNLSIVNNLLDIIDE